MAKAPAESTVLVVDDEASLREAVVFDLERRGYQVAEAANGNEALELVAKRKIDAVISDIRMPVCSGVELLGRLRERDLDTPAMILVTGFSDLEPEDAFDLGACGLLYKPYDRKVLHFTLARALLNREERWSDPQVAVGSPVSVSLRFPGKKQAYESELLKIGRGGMFVSGFSDFPWPDQQISFRISFETGDSPIEGLGKIRWTRVRPRPGLPAGCGIEFLWLNDSSRKELLGLVKTFASPSFIPKS